DVLYLFIYAQYDCIQFIDAQRKVYSTDSLSFFKLLFEEIQKKKLIWIYFMQVNHQLIDCSKANKNIQTLLDNISKLKNTVLEIVNLDQVNFLLDSNYKSAVSRSRFKKLAAVWQYVLSEDTNSSEDKHSLILYNPMTPSIYNFRYTKEPNTFFAYVLNIFMARRGQFKKAFILIGSPNKESKEDDDPVINEKIAEITKANGGYPYDLYNLIEYKLKTFLKDSIKGDLCPWFTIGVADRREYIQCQKNNVHLINPHPAGSPSKGVIEGIDAGITPIYFISFGGQIRDIVNVHLDLFLTLSSLKVAKVYINALNQKIGHNKYYIKNYSPVCVDFSFCVLSSIHRDCFEEFFGQTEYLLIRDIDCRNLNRLLRNRLYIRFPYVSEVPNHTQNLAEVSTDPVKVETTDDNLREICPRMCMPNTVYHITKHMVFMKSTHHIKVNFECEKYTVFDVLISKKEITNILTIEEKVRSASERKTRNEEIQNVLCKNKICSNETLYKTDGLIRYLDRLKHKDAQRFTILECSYVKKTELDFIVEQEKNKSTLEEEEEEEEEEESTLSAVRKRRLKTYDYPNNQTKQSLEENPIS
ncbi:hypothetical protein NEFER01_1520, partial [Nematocida sp. LUAm1]